MHMTQISEVHDPLKHPMQVKYPLIHHDFVSSALAFISAFLSGPAKSSLYLSLLLTIGLSFEFLFVLHFLSASLLETSRR